MVPHHPVPPNQYLRFTPLLSLCLHSNFLIPSLAPPHPSLKSPCFQCSSISVVDPSSTRPYRPSSPLNPLPPPLLLPLSPILPSLSSVLLLMSILEAKNNHVFIVFQTTLQSDAIYNLLLNQCYFNSKLMILDTLHFASNLQSS